VSFETVFFVVLAANDGTNDQLTFSYIPKNQSHRFPLLLVPTYEATDGNPTIFYGVVAGVLAGAVAGDHASPISDTTILSSLASECQVLAHTKTQAPYALIVVIWSIVVGTIPLGMGAFHNGVSIFLGFLAMLIHVVFTSEFIINKTGRYDIFTELYIRCVRNKEFYVSLKADVAKAFQTGMPVPLPEGTKSIVVDEKIEKYEGLDDIRHDMRGQEVVDAQEVTDDEPVVKSGEEGGSRPSQD
jgi:hypothetical protein